MAVPNVSAISLKPHLVSTFHQLPTIHHGNAFSVRELREISCLSLKASRPYHHSVPSDRCKSSIYAFCWLTRHVPMHSSSIVGDVAAENRGRIPHRQISTPRPWKSCQAKGEDSDSVISSDAVILDEQALERDLQEAIEEENYARAAKIRDSLRFLHEDSKASVLAANARFYNSFRSGDLATMQTLWAKGDNVCCVHPGVSGICGYDLVMGSWEFVWAEYEFPLEIEVKNIEAHVRGDIGYVTCTEVVKTKGSSWGKQFATNVFEKIDGRWYICIHHASYIDL